MNDLKKQVIDEIKKIYDPEIPVNIYDLGLIYKVELLEDKRVCQAIVAHFILIGNSLTPDKEEIVVIWSSDKLFTVILVLFFSIFKNSSVTFFENFMSLPFNISVRIEAEAKDNAHPSPLHLKPEICLSFSSLI